MGRRTDLSRARARTALAGAALAGLATVAAACGGSSTPTPSPTPSATSPTSSATSTAGLAQFKQVATGPLYVKLQQDLATFSKDAASGNLTATEADARLVAADITAWANALRAVQLPPAYAQAKSHILAGLDQMSKGVREVADGIHNRDTAQINKGSADVQAGVKLVQQAQSEVP